MFTPRMRSTTCGFAVSNNWICTGAGAGRQFLGHGVLRGLVQGQDLAGPLDDAHRQGRQARDLNAVAAVGGSGLDFAQEKDLLAGLFDGARAGCARPSICASARAVSS